MTFDMTVVRDQFTRLMDGAIAQWGDLTRHSEFLSNLLIAGVILAVTLFLSQWLSNTVKRTAKRYSHSDADRTLPEFLSQVVWWLVLIIGLVAILHRLGVQTTSILTVLGAASLAIGLALQGTLSNVAAGIMLLAQKPYRIGDVVNIGDTTGTVHRLGLFSTEITNGDHHKIYMPNAKVFSDRIINITHYGVRRVELILDVDYDTNLDAALKLLHDVAIKNPAVISQPEVWAGVEAFADSSVQLKLWAHVPVTQYIQARADLLLDIKKAFDAHGISIPYPHQIHLEKYPQAHPAPEPTT